MHAHLVTEFIVTLSKLGIRNPHGYTGRLFPHAPFHISLQALFEVVCVRSKRPDPQFMLDLVCDTFERILETAVTLSEP